MMDKNKRTEDCGKMKTHRVLLIFCLLLLLLTACSEESSTGNVVDNRRVQYTIVLESGETISVVASACFSSFSGGMAQGNAPRLLIICRNSLWEHSIFEGYGISLYRVEEGQ